LIGKGMLTTWATMAAIAAACGLFLGRWGSALVPRRDPALAPAGRGG
jgi:hypothetical protein